MKLILIFISQFSFLALCAQEAEMTVAKPILRPSYIFPLNIILENKTFYNVPTGSLVFQKPTIFMKLNTVQHYPGIFCKMENKIQAKSKLAPRFRLGSVNYTDWMEGKGEYFSRYWR